MHELTQLDDTAELLSRQPFLRAFERIPFDLHRSQFLLKPPTKDGTNRLKEGLIEDSDDNCPFGLS